MKSPQGESRVCAVLVPRLSAAKLARNLFMPKVANCLRSGFHVISGPHSHHTHDCDMDAQTLHFQQGPDVQTDLVSFEGFILA
jgi:chromosome condensin MukBEF MukE localization factor